MDFDQVYRRHYPALFRYLQRITGDPDVANDAAQEAFMRLLEHPMPEEEAKRWLFTVATNAIRDRARKQSTRRRLVPKVKQLAERPPQPDEAAERSEAVRIVRATLEKIPERDRQLLLLREEGFSYKEIAEAVGVAPGSVGTLIARAIKKFEAEYDTSNVENDTHS